MLTQQEIDEIKERCNNATPGEWFYLHGRPCLEEEFCTTSEVAKRECWPPDGICEETGDALEHTGLGIGVFVEMPRQAANIIFISHARQDIPALLLHIEELERQSTHTAKG